MGASLRDVAALAGVSVKTVSNVVNDYQHVRPSTRERVQRALAELNYRPNLAARNLRSGRSGIVALALPELDIPYFAELARCIIRAAEQQSWTVLLDQTDGLAAREAVVLDGIRDQLIDGLIFSPLASGPDVLARRRDDTPMVLLGERFAGSAADHVAIDNIAAAYDATTHLTSLGRQRIAAIGARDGAPAAATAHQRLAGYRQALTAAGRPRRRGLVAQVGWYHRSDGAGAMADLLDSGGRPDAVFCFSDLLALGALRTLAERGIRVPDDIAVIGFDDTDDGRFSTPSLSTISPDKERLATLAVDMLASRIAGDRTGPARDVQAPYTLLPRESTLGRG